LNLDILTKAEQRVESLRKQSFEMTDKENAIRTKLEQIESDLRPESIERNIAFVGSLRPEELRTARKKSLESERTNLQNALTEIQRTRTNLDLNVQKADFLVERLRVKLEAEIDSALEDNPSKP
jgi:predicted  nucleic acid-binding Zn-ribbon protein